MSAHNRLPSKVYLEWLGLESDQLPPNHYVLLGLDSMESDPARILAAAKARVASIRKYGEQHPVPCKQLLSEIKAAHDCLTNSEAKREYDAGLAVSDAVLVSELDVLPADEPLETDIDELVALDQDDAGFAETDGADADPESMSADPLRAPLPVPAPEKSSHPLTAKTRRIRIAVIATAVVVVLVLVLGPLRALLTGGKEVADNSPAESEQRKKPASTETAGKVNEADSEPPEGGRRFSKIAEKVPGGRPGQPEPWAAEKAAARAALENRNKGRANQKVDKRSQAKPRSEQRPNGAPMAPQLPEGFDEEVRRNVERLCDQGKFNDAGRYVLNTLTREKQREALKRELLEYARQMAFKASEIKRIKEMVRVHHFGLAYRTAKPLARRFSGRHAKEIEQLGISILEAGLRWVKEFGRDGMIFVPGTSGQFKGEWTKKENNLAAAEGKQIILLARNNKDIKNPPSYPYALDEFYILLRDLDGDVAWRKKKDAEIKEISEKLGNARIFKRDKRRRPSAAEAEAKQVILGKAGDYPFYLARFVDNGRIKFRTCPGIDDAAALVIEFKLKPRSARFIGFQTEKESLEHFKGHVMFMVGLTKSTPAVPGSEEAQRLDAKVPEERTSIIFVRRSTSPLLDEELAARKQIEKRSGTYPYYVATRATRKGDLSFRICAGIDSAAHFDARHRKDAARLVFEGHTSLPKAVKRYEQLYAKEVNARPKRRAGGRGGKRRSPTR